MSILLACAGVAWFSVGARALRFNAPVDEQAGAPGTARTVWDAVYSDAQASRGQAAYAQSCAACHADDLRGRSTAPSLVEESFAFLWGDRTVWELLTRTRSTMPLDRPGVLAADTYVDIVAYLLQKNGFPAGPAELAATRPVLETITISTANTPGA